MEGENLSKKILCRENKQKNKTKQNNQQFKLLSSRRIKFNGLGHQMGWEFRARNLLKVRTLEPVLSWSKLQSFEVVY